MLVFFLLPITLLSLISLDGYTSLPISGFRLTPPENIWAQLGEEVTLRCKSDKPIRSCAWMTPYEKNYVLEEGLKAEGGRLSYYSEEGEEGVKECGIRIRSIQEQDLGKWTCNIGVVEGDEIKSAAGQASVRLASPPSDISLIFSSPPTPSSSPNATTVEPVATCGVKYASPKPEFVWVIDGEDVVDPEVKESFSEENEEYSQVLTNLRDVMESSNATLTCEVRHMALNESLSESIDIYVEEEEYLDDLMNEDATLDLSELLLGEEEDDNKALNEVPVLIIIAVAILLTLSGIFFILHRRGKLNALCSGRDVVIDLDKNSEDEGKLNHLVDDSESTDSIVKQTVVVAAAASETSETSSSNDEEKKDLPEKKTNGGEVINMTNSPSKDNDISLTVNRFLSKFSLKNISIPASSADENDMNGKSTRDEEII